MLIKGPSGILSGASPDYGNIYPVWFTYIDTMFNARIGHMIYIWLNFLEVIDDSVTVFSVSWNTNIQPTKYLFCISVDV